MSATATTCVPGGETKLISFRHLCQILGVSEPTGERMKASGKLPRPIIFSAACHRWNMEEIRSWIDHGCPPLVEWERRRKAK